MKDSELMSEYNRKDWETSWGTNFPTDGVNDGEFFKIAEDKLRKMKIGKNTIENINFGIERSRNRQRYVLYNNNKG